MRTLNKIIEKHGGLAALEENRIRIENPPFMALCIQYLGTGPRGHSLVSVAHYYEQNFDLMRDPDMEFEVFDGGPEEKPFLIWWPVSYRQDSLGVYQVAAFLGDKGQLMTRPRLTAELDTFAQTWDRNIKQQGFLEAYKAA